MLALLLVLVSWAISHPPHALVFFNPLDLFAIADTAFIVSYIVGDGETSWFEGLMPVGAYLLLALMFFFAALL